MHVCAFINFDSVLVLCKNRDLTCNCMVTSCQHMVKTYLQALVVQIFSNFWSMVLFYMQNINGSCILKPSVVECQIDTLDPHLIFSGFILTATYVLICFSGFDFTAA